MSILILAIFVAASLQLVTAVAHQQRRWESTRAPPPAQHA
jgi:hypothetical protein